MTFVLPICILTLAGFTQGLTGFGFGLVSMALLPLAMPFRDALIVVAVLNVPVCLSTLFATRRHLSWRRGAVLTAGSCVGVPFGFYALVHADAQILLRILGGIIGLFAINELFFAHRFRIRFPSWAAFPVGLMSGGLGGAFNIGGPPVVAYAYSQSWTNEEIVAFLQMVFGTSALLRLALVGRYGLLYGDRLQLTLLAFLPLLVGIALGTRLLQRVPRERLNVIVFVFLLAIGAKYMLTT